MTQVGQQISNPRTGQLMTFVEMRQDLLRIDTLNPVTDEREPLHVHPVQESGAELISGSLVFEVDGVRRKLAPGDSISIPANTRHRFWNDGDEDAHWIGCFRPALATADFFETLFALAAADKLDGKGMPRPLQLAVMVPEFENEIRPVSPPWPILRAGAAAAVLGPLARARGYRARVTA
jgi:mannose-6-phosphate isomerase-like protein (cupin superfamily)